MERNDDGMGRRISMIGRSGEMIERMGSVRQFKSVMVLPVGKVKD